MQLSKYKFIAFIAILMSCFAATVQADEPSVERTEKPLFLSDGGGAYNFVDDGNQDLRLGDALHRMLIAVFVVVILGVAAMYTSKKVLPKFAKIQGKKIKVTETLHLGSRKMLYLVEIEGRRLLIGSTADRISTLADFIEPSSGEGFAIEPNTPEEVS